MGNQELELDELKELDEQIRYHADLFFNKIFLKSVIQNMTIWLIALMSWLLFILM